MNLYEQINDIKKRTIWTNEFVLNEVLTTLWSYNKQQNVLKRAYNLIRNSSRFYFINDELLDHSWNLWEKYTKGSQKSLSFTDCSIIAVCENLGITDLGSFNKEFTGILNLIG